MAFFGATLALAAAAATGQGQPPFAASSPSIPISGSDRFYLAEQFSNTVSVIDPSTNRYLGAIRLGDPAPGNVSPLYRGQLLVHGMGFSPDRKTLVVVSIGSNSVTFIDTATNRIRHTTYVGRSPHEAFFTPDGREVWVTIRGEDFVTVLDGRTFQQISTVKVPNGPGMTIFSPDGRFGYVCSSFTPETVVVSTRTKKIVGRVPQDSSFCPNIAATPDGTQVWLTLKDIGRVMIFDARPPFRILGRIDTGAITNHVNFVSKASGQFAYVTVGTENAVKVYRTDDFSQVASIAVGAMPHGIWPSGDGSRIYVGIENGDQAVAIDTSTNSVVATIPVGQGPQGVAYVSGAVPTGEGLSNLVPLGVAATKMQLVLQGTGRSQVTLFDQGQIQILQAAVAGLDPGKPYLLALAKRPDGGGTVQPLAEFITNRAGAAIVNSAGPIRQIVDPATAAERRYLIIAPGTAKEPRDPVQVQVANP